MFVILAAFLEGSEVVFNRVQVRRIRRKKEDSGPLTGDEVLGGGAFMEGPMVQDYDRIVGEQRAEFLSQPGSEDHGVARALKEERSGKGVTDARGNQRGTGTFVAAAHPRHPLPYGRIGRAARDAGGKAALLKGDALFAAPPIAFSQAQLGLALPRVALGVAQRFFSTIDPDGARRTKDNAVTPRTGAPAPVACDRGGLRHRPAALPSPNGEGLWVPGVERPIHLADRSSYKHWRGRPESGARLLSCSHRPGQTQ